PAGLLRPALRGPGGGGWAGDRDGVAGVPPARLRADAPPAAPAGDLRRPQPLRAALARTAPLHLLRNRSPGRREEGLIALPPAAAAASSSRTVGSTTAVTSRQPARPVR